MLCWKTVAALSSMFADRAPSSHNSKPWGIPVCREVEGGACCELSSPLSVLEHWWPISMLRGRFLYRLAATLPCLIGP